MFFILSSCVPVKDQIYVQDKEYSLKKQQEKVYVIETREQVEISAGDELFITVSSADEGATMFNAATGGAGATNPYLSSYTVSADGSATLPYIGKIILEKMTIKEAEAEITGKLAEFLYLPNVAIKLINTRIYVLGEVNGPGVYFFNGANMNILQALSYAGDISTFGNKKKVLIIRGNGEQTSKKYIDITSDKAINSNEFIIQPEDIIYVEPLRRKKWGVENNLVTLSVTLINTALLAYTLLLTSTLQSQ